MGTLGDIARTANAVPVIPLVSAIRGREEGKKKRKLGDILEEDKRSQGRKLGDILNKGPLAEVSAADKSTLAFARDPLSSLRSFEGILPTLKEEFTQGLADVRSGVGVPSSAGVLEDLKGQGKAAMGAARSFFSPVTALVRPLVARPAGEIARSAGASERAAKMTELGAEIGGNLLFPGIGLLPLPRAARRAGELTRASSAGAAQVAGADVGLAAKPPLGERALDAGKKALRGVSPLVGGRSIRYLDEPAKYSPTLKGLRDEIEHPQAFELQPGQIAAPDFTEKILRTTGGFMSRVNNAIQPLRGRQGFLSGEARGKLATDIRIGQVGAGAEIRKVLDEVHDYARQAGLDVPYRAGYFPRVYNDFLRTETGAQKWGQTLKKYGIDFDDGERIRQKIVDDDFVDLGAAGKGAPGVPGAIGKPSWMKNRGLGHIPDEVLAPFLHNDPRSVLAKYVPSVVKRAEHARLFGPAGEKLEQAIPKIREELGQAGRGFSAKEESQLRGISDALAGKYKPIASPELAKANRLMMSYQFVRTLPKAVLSSLSEPFIALETGSAKGFAKAILPSIGYAGNAMARGVFPKIKKGEEGRMLDELGLTLDSSLRDILSEGLPKWVGGLRGVRGEGGQLLGEAADTSALPAGRGLQAYFKLNLLEPWTKFARALTYNSAKFSILDALKTGKTKGLREFGIDPTEAVGWYQRVGSAKSPLETSDPYQEVMQNGILRFINETVMMPRPATKPLWMSDPHWALLGQLKSYQGNFGNTVGRRWIEQTRNTFRSDEDMAKTAKMVGTAGLMATTAVIANEFREWLSYGEGGDPKFKSEKPGKKVLRAMDRAGFTGGLQPGVDLVWGQRFGRAGALSQPLGPTATQLEGVITGVQDLAKRGDPKALQFQGISAIPGYNVLPSAKKRTLREALISR